MITVILDSNNIVTAISESPYKPIFNLEEGQSSLEVESLPKLRLEYYPSTKTFIKSNRVKFKEIRQERDALLSAADYTQLSDSTYPSTQDAWKTYRQQLTDPDTIVFPEEPK